MFMEQFKYFDKINVPMYICTDEWIVLYRNKACKKWVTSPRVNSNLSKYFLGKEKTPAPQIYGGCVLNGGFIKDVYKTALCFRYKEYVVAAFPTLLDFDIIAFWLIPRIASLLSPTIMFTLGEMRFVSILSFLKSSRSH